MAFMGRGAGPSLGNNGGGPSGFGGRRGRYRRYYYGPIDSTYIMMETIATLAVLALGLIIYLLAYQSKIVDPIVETKKLFINSHVISILGILLVTLLINLFPKNEVKLAKRLLVTFVISIVIMLAFLGIKLNLDSTYTNFKFREIYNEQVSKSFSGHETKINISLSGIETKTEKEFYVDECVKLYDIFKAKTFGLLGLHLLLNCLLMYQIVRVLNIRDKKDKRNKDDLILFDEENVFKN